MANKKTDTYKPKATPITIKATSRIALKINDTFYTLEYCEERLVPDIDDVDIAKEREILWDAVNSEVDKQAEDVQKMYKK